MTKGELAREFLANNGYTPGITDATYGDLAHCFTGGYTEGYKACSRHDDYLDEEVIPLVKELIEYVPDGSLRMRALSFISGERNFNIPQYLGIK